MKKRLILLDVHAILHRAYHAMPDFATSKGLPTGGLYGLCTMILKIVEDLRPDFIAACYDLPKPTYRHDIYKDYKAGRAKTDENLVTQIIKSREIFEAFGISTYEKEGFEADDMLGTIVEKMKERDDIEIVIASGDMDTLQLVVDRKVMVYTLKKGIRDTILYDEDAVLERFGFEPLLLPDYKGLRGDPSDNIIGIKGIGEKTATILIKEFGSIENIYENLKKGEEVFKKIGITERVLTLLKEGEEEALFSKMLATIRRDAPITFSLPEMECCDTVDMKKIDKLFAELEFRSLGNRVKTAFRIEGYLDKKVEDKEVTAVKENIDPKQIRKVSIALWVLDSNLTNPSLEDILKFSQKDNFKDASEYIFEELEKRNVSSVYKSIELPLMPVVERMEERGVKIDKKYLEDLSKKYHKELSRLEKEIHEMAGSEFNINSPKQMGEVLFDKMKIEVKGLKKTAGGARSTKESELLKLKDQYPIVGKILEYRELQKLLSTYIDNIPTMLDANDRLHTTLIQAGSTTGRMASQNPGVQNIPIKTELGRAIRNAFIAERGFEIVTFDYSQIELRIAAFLSGDEKLLEIFRNGEDVHTAVASEVFGVAKENVDKEMRRKAKVINFGIMYGMGVNALRVNLGTDRKEAQKFYNDYFEKFSTLANYLEKVKDEALKNGYTETLCGRRRYFEGLKSKLPFIRAAAERMAINAPIQGTGADLVKKAMVNIEDWIKEKNLSEDIYPLLQVHDELVYEMKKEIIDNVVPEVKKIMENVFDENMTKGVVTIAEAYKGRNWGELNNI